VPEPRSPPPPIQPIKSEPYHLQQQRMQQERRTSMSTHHTDKTERIESEFEGFFERFVTDLNFVAVEESEFLQPVDSSTPVSMDRDFARNLENIKTKLFSVSSANHFTYNRVNWKLHIRKEVGKKRL
jgi:hypothetical protein